MQSMDLQSLARRTSARRDARRLSRRGFLKIALVASGGLGLTLVGCSPDDSPVEGVDGHMAVIDKWIKAVNTEDVTQFEQLHTEAVVFNSYLQQSPYNGRRNIWGALRYSNARPIDKIYMFGQEDFICLQVTAAVPKRSFLYVFRLERGLIAQVHEYAAAYDLSDVPLFDGADIITDDADIPQRIATVDSQLDALNERDLSRFTETFNDNAIQYGAADKIPIRGAESIRNDVLAFLQSFPTVELNKYRTFGQGNLVCQEVAVKNVDIRSLGHLFVFEGGKVAMTYQYLSNAELGS